MFCVYLHNGSESGDDTSIPAKHSRFRISRHLTDSSVYAFIDKMFLVCVCVCGGGGINNVTTIVNGLS